MYCSIAPRTLTAGNWPLAIFEAGVANAVGTKQAGVLRRVLVAALGRLAGHRKFKDTGRPRDRVLWRVDHVRQIPPDPFRIQIDGGHDLQIRLLQGAAGNAAADGSKAHQCDFDCQLAPPAPWF